MMFNNLYKNKYNTITTLEREKVLLVLRWGSLLAIFLWWWFTSSSPVGVALILVLSSTTLIKMQFSNSFWLIIFEEVTCYFITFYWPSAIFALMIPAFESGMQTYVLTFLPILIIVIFKAEGINMDFILLLNLMAFIIGYLLKAWGERESLYLTAVDRERKQRYEVEQLKNELLVANSEVAKLVEATERNRISQQLHDNVGHEITGALIALQAYKKLNENKDNRAEKMLENVLKRMENSSIKLRETVYQLRPSTEGGAARLQKLCEEFTYCEIKYRFTGDKDRVPALIWVILEPCLKEAFTNISKYSKATEIEVSFDVTQYIVRMFIKDNGIGAKDITPGLGLFGIRERITAASGTVSVDGSNGFMLTCILPIDK